MSEEQTTYQQAERQAAMMHSTLVASLAKNQMTIFHSSPSDFLRPYDSKRPEVERMHTQEESTNDCIDAYKEFRTMVLDIQADYSDEKAKAMARQSSSMERLSLLPATALAAS